MKILAIDTSCDETAAAVVDGRQILSNIIWSQASLHAKWGGILPSLAQREHQERIDWVIAKAIQAAKIKIEDVGALAVTIGPGLAVALEVGILKAKQLAKRYDKPIITVNHLEGHLLSPLAKPNLKIDLPAFGLVASGGNTQFVWLKKIGHYQPLAQTRDDALGEALDKAARLLGLGYPGGAILETMAKKGRVASYTLPLPLKNIKEKNYFSYSGLKTAFVRLVSSLGNLNQEKIYNLAASFQDMAFKHLLSVISYQIDRRPEIKSLLVGGGVGANLELRKRLRRLAKQKSVQIFFPPTKKLYGDNAAMIGIVAGFKLKRKETIKKDDFTQIDRLPRAQLD